MLHLEPKDARPALKLRPWKINNKPQGFPGAPVHQVFAVLLQITQDATLPYSQLQNTEHRIEGRSPKSRKMEKFFFYITQTTQLTARKPQSPAVQNAQTTSRVANQYDQT